MATPTPTEVVSEFETTSERGIQSVGVVERGAQPLRSTAACDPYSQDRQDDDDDFERRGAFRRRTRPVQGIPHGEALAARTPNSKGLSINGAQNHDRGRNTPMGVFAEFEKAMIQERVKAGLERAKTQGKTLGRPEGRRHPC